MTPVGVERLVAELRTRLAAATRPLAVALDGRSGSGKSMLAARLAAELGATVVPSDDFFAAEVTDAGWDARTAAERAADAIDWRRVRDEALAPLLAGRPARWTAFDFEAGVRPDGTYSMRREPRERAPSKMIILEGAYSARPDVSDLIDVTVLVEAGPAIRHKRLAARESPEFLERWHARWDPAEEHYFGTIRPAASFDFVVTADEGETTLDAKHRDWPWPDSLDALIAAPRHHSLLLENDRVRVLDTRIAPGDTTPIHTHRWPSVHCVIRSGDFVRRDGDGKVLVDTRIGGSGSETPPVLWSEPLPPHSLENVSRTEIHIISVELKAGAR